MNRDTFTNISEADMPFEQDINPQGKPNPRRRSDLRQWGAEQMRHPTKADLDALRGHDPQKLLFMSLDKSDKQDYPNPSLVPFFEKVGVAASAGLLAVAGYRRQPTIYHLNSAKEGTHDTRVIYHTIEEHLKKYGPLEELMIDGHGEKNKIGRTAQIEAWGLLQQMVVLQEKLGIKPAKRIVFYACDVFADLSPNDVRRYKSLAKQLGAEVVGATTTVVGSAGRFVQFTPEGTVKRDRLDSPIGVWMHRLQMPKGMGENDMWMQSRHEAWLTRELNGQQKPTGPRGPAPAHQFKP
jgi:hypothetical protein